MSSSQTNKMLVQASAAGVGIAITGATAGAASAATVILATGGASALILAGVGIYKYLKRKR